MKIIKEAEEREFETATEKRLKKKLIALLRDDGKGHRHAKFANRLEDFIVKIVPRTEDPNMTAAVSWEEVTIYVSDGFVTNDDEIFGQLNVVLRHELAHYLMQHNIRMLHKLTAKYGEKGYTHLSMSKSLHEILNIIMDFEISNKRYTNEDKVTMRNLIIGGRLVTALVTEDHRRQWINLPLEDMYDEIEKEIEGIQRSILAKWDTLDMTQIGNGDFVQQNLVNLNMYSVIDRPTNFFGTLDKFINNKALYHFAAYDQMTDAGVRPCIAKFSSLSDAYKEIITAIDKEFTEANGYLKQNLRDAVTAIAKTSPLVVYDIKDKKGKVITTLYAPEEKLLAVDAFKARIPELEEYNTWYGKVQKTLADQKYSDADLQKIYDEINK